MKISSDIANRKFGNEILLYNKREGTSFLINEAEIIIWEMLMQHKFNKETAVKKIIDEYEVTKEQLEQDIDMFLAELKKCKIIEH